MRRFVLQFRFEIRIGVEEDQVAFIHRVTAPPNARAFDRSWFERTLTQSLDPPAQDTRPSGDPRDEAQPHPCM